MMEWIYGGKSSGPSRTNGQGVPKGYDANGNRMTTKTARKGTETKKLPKWAVPFYSGKMGM